MNDRMASLDEIFGWVNQNNSFKTFNMGLKVKKHHGGKYFCKALFLELIYEPIWCVVENFHKTGLNIRVLICLVCKLALIISHYPDSRIRRVSLALYLECLRNHLLSEQIHFRPHLHREISLEIKGTISVH